MVGRVIRQSVAIILHGSRCLCLDHRQLVGGTSSSTHDSGSGTPRPRCTSLRARVQPEMAHECPQSVMRVSPVCHCVIRVSRGCHVAGVAVRRSWSARLPCHGGGPTRTVAPCVVRVWSALGRSWAPATRADWFQADTISLIHCIDQLPAGHTAATEAMRCHER